MWQLILINGLISGGQYALLALGFSLIFGVARILNLAHTAYYMLTAFAIYYFSQVLDISLPLTYLLSLVFVVVLAVGVYQLAMAPVRGQSSTVMIVSLVLAIVAQELVLIAFGGQFRSLPKLVPGTIEFGGTLITYQHLFTLGAVLTVLLGVWLLLFKSKLGIAIRAVALDREVANLMGMPENSIATLTMAISVALAAVAAAMVAPLGVIEPLMWLHPLVVVMAAVILGGLGSIKGSIIGAFTLAFVEVSLVFLIPQASFLRGAVSMATMLLVLLFKPEGLFGVFMEGER
ncbi:MAG: branched-chain amino acid ABC transporter permease [Dethiobacter sp.]|nr:branched-chain amino acid ABC transporter permease [Dethiobacter sp.]